MFGGSWQRSVRKKIQRDNDSLKFRIGEAALLSQKAASGAFVHLWDAEVQVYSQWGEDGILDFLCDCLGLAKPRVLELGAGNFAECNSRFLAEHRNASVVAVDARKDLSEIMRSIPLYWRTSLFPIEDWITPESAPLLLSKAKSLMSEVDIISLDIDGNDYWVAESLDMAGVQLFVVEYNALLGHEQPVTVPRDDRFDRATAHSTWLYFGVSLRAWVYLFEQRGFTFIGTNRAGCNAFFCESEQARKIPLSKPSTIDLAPYVDWRVRESRDPEGNLSYLAGPDRVDAIGSLPLVNVVTGEMTSVFLANSCD